MKQKYEFDKSSNQRPSSTDKFNSKSSISESYKKTDQTNESFIYNNISNIYQLKKEYKKNSNSHRKSFSNSKEKNAFKIPENNTKVDIQSNLKDYDKTCQKIQRNFIDILGKATDALKNLNEVKEDINQVCDTKECWYPNSHDENLISQAGISINQSAVKSYGTSFNSEVIQKNTTNGLNLKYYSNKNFETNSLYYFKNFHE